MATVYFSPVGNGQTFFNSSGVALAGGQIFTYIAGTTTPIVTYTDNTGTTPNANPIVLNSAGQASSEIWLTQSVKFIVKDSLGVTIQTIDNIPAINNVSNTASEWVASGLTPTYISATSFSVGGDQTIIFTTSRRLKIVVTAGTIYGSITSATFGSGITTIVATIDSGSIDSGISAVSYGFADPTNISIAKSIQANTSTNVSGIGNASAFETRYGSAMFPIAPTDTSNALGGSLGACKLDFRNPTLKTGTPVSAVVATTLALPAVPTTSSLGAVTAQLGTFVYGVAYNGGTPVACIANAGGGLVLDGSVLVSPTTIGASSNAANVLYSAAAVGANSPFTPIALMQATWTSGTGWAITQVQPFGGSNVITLSDIGAIYQNVTASRALGTTYFNTKLSRRGLIITGSFAGGTPASISASLNGGTSFLIGTGYASTGTTYCTGYVDIGAGVSYSITFTNLTTIVSWMED